MDLAAAKQNLQARLAQLNAHIHQIEDTLDAHHNPDWSELAIEREGDEVLEGLGLQNQHEMAQIKAALARIEAGSYGQCTKCGGDIQPKRLALLPHTPFCASCA
jgi:RNA polymerase-binding transcription factor DksA